MWIYWSSCSCSPCGWPRRCRARAVTWDSPPVHVSIRDTVAQYNDRWWDIWTRRGTAVLVVCIQETFEAHFAVSFLVRWSPSLRGASHVKHVHFFGAHVIKGKKLHILDIGNTCSFATDRRCHCPCIVLQRALPSFCCSSEIVSSCNRSSDNELWTWLLTDRHHWVLCLCHISENDQAQLTLSHNVHNWFNKVYFRAFFMDINYYLKRMTFIKIKLGC